MFRRSYVQKVHVRKVLCSEGPMLKNPIISSSYVQKVLFVQKVLVQKILCPEGLMFRSSYIQKLLFSECPVLNKKRNSTKNATRRGARCGARNIAKGAQDAARGAKANSGA